MTVTKKQVLFAFLSIVLTALLGCGNVTASRREADVRGSKFISKGVSGYEYSTALQGAARADNMRQRSQTDHYVRTTMADAVADMIAGSGSKAQAGSSEQPSVVGEPNACVINRLSQDVQVWDPGLGAWLELPGTPANDLVPSFVPIHVREGDRVKVRYKGSSRYSEVRVRYRSSDPNPVVAGRQFGWKTEVAYTPTYSSY